MRVPRYSKKLDDFFKSDEGQLFIDLHFVDEKKEKERKKKLQKEMEKTKKESEKERNRTLFHLLKIPKKPHPLHFDQVYVKGADGYYKNTQKGYKWKK